MPSVSAKQERFMQAVAHNPKFAKKVGVPTSVGKEFTKSGGGMAESKKMVGKEVSFMKKKLTSSKTASDPNSRINKSLRAWKC